MDTIRLIVVAFIFKSNVNLSTKDTEIVKFAIMLMKLRMINIFVRFWAAKYATLSDELVCTDMDLFFS